MSIFPTSWAVAKIDMAPILAALALAACASRPAPPPADAAAPQRPDPRLCTPVRTIPPLPPGASIVQPVTDEERSAVAAFLGWVFDLGDVARENQGRAEIAKRPCTPPP